MPTVTINGTSVAVTQGTLLLKAVQNAGIHIPTLCHHDALAPYGACRLCMVLITAPRRALVASCTYPVEEDLAVETHAPEAVQARRLALEALLARCPGSDAIRKMAEKEGVTASRFSLLSHEHSDELCVLCGLCVRICRDLIGAAAIAFVGRGSERKVGTPFDLHTEACIGCETCVDICLMDVLAPNPEEGMPPVVAYPDECWFCGSCVDMCPQEEQGAGLKER